MPPETPPDTQPATSSVMQTQTNISPSLIRILKSEGGRSCAACKHQRRRCKSDCILAPYFPSNHPDRFAKVHRLFGLHNVVRLLKVIAPEDRDDAVESIVFEACAHARDPVGGSYRIVKVLERCIENTAKELRDVERCIEYVKSSKTLGLIDQVVDSN